MTQRGTVANDAIWHLLPTSINVKSYNTSTIYNTRLLLNDLDKDITHADWR